MGIPDSSLLDLIEKVRSWIYWGTRDLTSLSVGFGMADKSCKMCCECEMSFTEPCLKFQCRSCSRMLCVNCAQSSGSLDVVTSDDLKRRKDVVFDIITCRLCFNSSDQQKSTRRFIDKIYPSESPRQSPEPPSPNFSGEKVDEYSLYAATKSSVTSFSSHPSPISVRHSPSRSDEDDGEDSTSQFFSPSSEYYHDTSDIESSSISARHEFFSFRSIGSSPSDSPSRTRISSERVGRYVQREQGGTRRSQHDGPLDQDTAAVLRKPKDPEAADDCADDLSIYEDRCENLQQPLDFENNGLIWFPPPPEDEHDEAENDFFTYSDEDDEIGDDGAGFAPSRSLSSMFSAKDRHNVDNREPLRARVQGHFRALVSQLLQGDGLSAEDWLDTVTAIAWQAANFVKPDTSRGGSMDPVDYVRIKCVASGSPGESTVVKGVVCTKNIKHKRMTSQYKSPRLLLLGGALEYQKVPNQLASFDTLLQQEMDHVKMIVSKIEAHRTNVLLVEKSVSSYAQEYLLAKEISLVLNVKRPLLERIARCTGALITPSVDNIPATRLGHCELFHLQKFTEEHEPVNQFNKKPSKTLMFFEGCPRRLGCTVLLKGSCREELKKVKHVIQYAVFAAYHLSLETSFLADEGASLPKTTVKPSISVPEKVPADRAISLIPNFDVPAGTAELLDIDVQTSDFSLEMKSQGLQLEGLNFGSYGSTWAECGVKSDLSGTSIVDMKTDLVPDDFTSSLFAEDRSLSEEKELNSIGQEDIQPDENSRVVKVDGVDETEASSEYFSASDNHQSILVSFSSRCVLNGTVCERSRLLRIKFYGCFDKPLGRYLQDDLFDQSSCCHTCKEPAEAHVICYTHQQGNLTINVKRLPTTKLPGEREGKIWMWHRCLRCAHVDGIPPATRRVVMSDAAWGLSFGKFLELSFSNHATANRVASCGHSLQRDCLRYYGFGSMVAFFRYSPIDILSVRLPPSLLEFNSYREQKWTRREATELLGKVESLYSEVSGILNSIEQKTLSPQHEQYDATELHNHIMELKELLVKEKNDYCDMLQAADEESLEQCKVAVDILELNRLRHSLLIGSHVWNRRLYSLESLLKQSSSVKVPQDVVVFPGPQTFEHVTEENVGEHSKLQECTMEEVPFKEEEPNISQHIMDTDEGSISITSEDSKEEKMVGDKYNEAIKVSLERAPSAASVLSDQIDLAWTGTDLSPEKTKLRHSFQTDKLDAASFRQINQTDIPPFRRITCPSRVYSFDSAVRLQERIRKRLPPSSLHLSTIRSFHASGDYRNMVRDPVTSVERTYSQLLPHEAQKLNISPSSLSPFISSLSLLPEGARLMVPQNGHNDVVIAVYDNEPTSIISYALISKEYEDWVTDKPMGSEGGSNHINRESSISSNLSAWQSFGSLDLDYIHYGSYGSEDASATISSFFADTKTSPHLRISFEDESLRGGGKVKFSVTCYFAKQFDALRRRCCPNEVDFVRSLSRCRRWSAQGGKSNVYFAKSFDERFIIKQVTKTELESFEEFAGEYFKYLTDSIASGSPTCLAKVLGIYQVTVKQLKGGKETKMDLMVMENLFYERNISKVYDLKGSARSRYNSDTTGTNKVMLDMNLLETLRTKPIFLGSKAKRSLERAVWNDTSFLASVDVMDYSLLVGVDEEQKELVLGIIDFMRQYTWDKHLETWVKASGILGGPKNASPTIISPKQYKKRFRKAMTTYFLTVPDQWSS